jgi:hypothetical protein
MPSDSEESLLPPTIKKHHINGRTKALPYHITNKEHLP